MERNGLTDKCLICICEGRQNPPRADVDIVCLFLNSICMRDLHDFFVNIVLLIDIFLSLSLPLYVHMLMHACVYACQYFFKPMRSL